MSEFDFFILFGMASFLAIFVLVLTAGAWLMDRYADRAKEQPVSLLAPTLTARFAAWIKTRYQTFQSNREAARKKRELRRPPELWGPFPEIRIALRHRTLRYRQNRIVLSDYSDGTTVGTVIASSRLRTSLGSAETLTHSDNDWLQMIKTPIAA